jgi:hypothetical protein
VKRVFVCSPFRGDVERNLVVARDACRQVLREGDAPFAPHLLYPSLLDDGVPAERDLGIRAGLAWLAEADEVLVVGEPTEGMLQEIAAADTLGIPIRRIDAAEPSPVARPASFGDALRCRLVSVWADWGTLLALVAVVVLFLLCPGCVAGARREDVAPVATAGGT